ncbi:MAG: preprotein translocase subunit SecG [Candidatus Omnitrophica bacterium]|jgi:preprotein translocase subunit SecG|nr:preprotein translocase subunit SecG [Candidatus Omnitrophota bacterium]MDD4013788.1 preprotein translocase subunit SecG [Candidatus Omnitrophota bacterium]
MYWVIIAVHVVVCLILIAVILLQAGRGGGLSETMGGDTAQSVLGTQAPTVLKRATEVSAIAFIVTCLILGMMTARSSRSIMGAGVPVTTQAMPIVPGSSDMPEENPLVDY